MSNALDRQAIPPRRLLDKNQRSDAAGHAGCGVKIAYMMSRFPKLTESFVLHEMLAVEELGLTVELYPLRRERATVMHPEAEPLVQRANYTPWLSLAIFWAHLCYLWRKPGTYIRTLWTLLRANWGSLRYFGAAVAFFPKAVYLARRMEVEGITHLHAHFCSHPAAVAFVIHRLTGIPYSFTAHGTDLHCDRHMLREKVAAADFVVAISNYNHQIILNECGNGHADKVVVVRCGIDPHRFRPRTRHFEHERRAGPFRIVCIGTLHAVKGQRYLIEACRLLRERGVDFDCHLIGGGPDESALREQVSSLSLSDRVRFQGWRSGNEVAEFLQRVDVVVAPSVPTASGQREGIPVALMEAMASGVAVVASDLSGIPELVKDGTTGLLVPPCDAAGLANALQRLDRDASLRRCLATAGRQRVLREFDVMANAAKLAERFEHNRVCP